MTFKQKLIDYGYPKTLMEDLDEAFCKQEWKVLSQYLPQPITRESESEEEVITHEEKSNHTLSHTTR